MHNGYKKINGVRVPVHAPENPALPPERLTLPDDHPCHGCPIIDLNCSKPYCFLPRCLRKEFEKRTDGEKI